MNNDKNAVMDADWVAEAEHLEERIEHLEREDNRTAWALLATAVVLVALAVKVVLL